MESDCCVLAHCGEAARNGGGSRGLGLACASLREGSIARSCAGPWRWRITSSPAHARGHSVSLLGASFCPAVKGFPPPVPGPRSHVPLSPPRWKAAEKRSTIPSAVTCLSASCRSAEVNPTSLSVRGEVGRWLRFLHGLHKERGRAGLCPASHGSQHRHPGAGSVAAPGSLPGITPRAFRPGGLKREQEGRRRSCSQRMRAVPCRRQLRFPSSASAEVSGRVPLGLARAERQEGSGLDSPALAQANRAANAFHFDLEDFTQNLIFSRFKRGTCNKDLCSTASSAAGSCRLLLLL